jgi:hypothetical protein
VVAAQSAAAAHCATAAARLQQRGCCIGGGSATAQRRRQLGGGVAAVAPSKAVAACDNILSGYLCAVTTVFSQQDGIYGFKFPKRFLEISSRDLTLFSLFSSLLN